MQQYWFGDVDAGVCTKAEGDTAALAARVSSLQTSMESFVPLSWEQARECGLAVSREEYLRRVRELCAALANERLAEYFSTSDIELLQMVRMLDEIDTVVNLLSERAVEWYQVRHPKISQKYRKWSQKTLVQRMKGERGSPLSRIAKEMEGLSSARTSLAKAVSSETERIAPNCSALVGGLVAARLISRAGGLEAMARLPASTIQVLGAENALFTHIRSGTPSPKHGIIFQHRRIHSAPKEVRGKVARGLAGKLSIAAKIDCYRGEIDPGFLEEAQRRIDDLGASR
ncbi:MAG: NOP5/NOP56 family protein [Methanomicrobiaceae archaeon]|nr:NOP5/NOP56 family protein [Methanomicrobiaceae archaeon]